ncbi:GroES-like protein [Artomyces pyxidatus]|uniref:GroES-like protein n=1 Tax=Artomyces pyxidatus TaxID=48021 RepID=A0ACB8SLL5_9AGAM|nr:GroES-like protein [Artomyces pyxidatus]
MAAVDDVAHYRWRTTLQTTLKKQPIYSWSSVHYFAANMAPQQQKAIILPEKFADFIVGNRPVPSPGPGFVLVKIIAAALNPCDNYIQKYDVFVPEYPAVVGCDGAGIVEAVGEGVRNLQVGDKVLYQSHWTADRCALQQYGLADACRIAKIPGNLSFEEAATIPSGLATAALGMYAKKSARGGAELRPPWEGGMGRYSGQAMLVIGGSSSVGQFAIQLARLSGFSPIITTASARNEAYCKAAGATHVMDYNVVPYAELPAAVKAITGGPVPFVYDAISLSESQKASWETLAPNGFVVITLTPEVGKPGAEAEDGKRTVWVFGMVHDEEHQEMGGRMYSKLTDLLASGVLKPNKVELVPYGLAGVPAALDRLRAGKVSGVKLVAHPQESE